MKYLPSAEGVEGGMYRYVPFIFETTDLYNIRNYSYQQKNFLTDTVYKTVYLLLHMIRYSKNVNVFPIFILLHGQSIPGYAQENDYFV